MTKKKKKSIISRILPREYDFFSVLAEHSEKVREGVATFVLWIKTNEPSLAQKVRHIEHEADELKFKIASELGKVFSTPIDREDIHLIINYMDQIINYTKNTVREIQIFSILPDDYMIEMGIAILEGVCALCEALSLFPSPAQAEITEHLTKAKKSEHRVEWVYRKSVNELFEMEDIKEILKRREVYRHLSNTADRILEAAQLLAAIAVKYY